MARRRGDPDRPVACTAHVGLPARLERLVGADLVALVVDRAVRRLHQLAEDVVEPLLREVALLLGHPLLQAEVRLDDESRHVTLLARIRAAGIRARVLHCTPELYAGVRRASPGSGVSRVALQNPPAGGTRGGRSGTHRVGWTRGPPANPPPAGCTRGGRRERAGPAAPEGALDPRRAGGTRGGRSGTHRVGWTRGPPANPRRAGCTRRGRRERAGPAAPEGALAHMIHEASSGEMRTDVLPSVGAVADVQTARRRVAKGRGAGHSGHAAVEARGPLREDMSEGSRKDRRPAVLPGDGGIGCG